MGKGDQKSTKGKRVRGSYGKTRPRKSSKTGLLTEERTKDNEEKTSSEEKPKAKRTKKA
ncbi:30S ribosomal protein THX [Epilithonimonas hominis]|nr:30S ribosomal protein THX [Epilithonimonas hominis]